MKQMISKYDKDMRKAPNRKAAYHIRPPTKIQAKEDHGKRRLSWRNHRMSGGWSSVTGGQSCVTVGQSGVTGG